MLSVSDAENIIFNLVQPLNTQQDTELVDLLSTGDTLLDLSPWSDGFSTRRARDAAARSADRILASQVTSELDFPHWDNSAMDGYAVRYEDVYNCNEDKPAVLEIVEEIPAGVQPKSTIQSGQAARIFTGAVMPTGTDTVVMQERTRREGNRVIILTAPKLQEFVRKRGMYYRAGEQLLPPGILLKASEIAVLAAFQCTQLKVFRRPRVAIFSTGDELVTPDKPLQPGQIVDSNRYALATLIRQSGAEPIMLGIVKDKPEALKEAIAYAIAHADIVISSGGVSVGDYDYVEQILESLGGKIHVRDIATKPGKPLTVATFENDVRPIVYFGLPGNPVAALVTFWRFVQPAIKKLSGLAQGWEPVYIKALARQELCSGGKRETYVWGQLSVKNGVYEFQPAGGLQNSGNLINLAQTNGLAVLPVGTTLIAAKEQVQVLQIGS
ncbi:molybdopterin molybdotransferase MoeA [Brasilonema octagenarum]|uniref:Molybdopterin molybdenumtransferase n=1 Tax=Brasilonema octagenarum UFV-OR1 TaxID=417115 RepID=A0ABX1M820_9CYAN|nr:gephyrin-like molybdotransferase Glp [Brasilonema octagenarum]NMF64715.1 molybdopterin molybdenumtransferase MoeA [Brasilonema octagenarum UFV-OR1]